MSVVDYATKMKTGSHWGGAIEIAVLGLTDNVQVRVFERQGSEFVEISRFDAGESNRVVNVVYSGRVHYDALEGGTEVTEEL